MANQYLGKNKLYVEGRDDLFVVADLLKANGFQMDVEPRDIQIDDAAKGDEGQGREKLLALIKTAVKASTGKRSHSSSMQTTRRRPLGTPFDIGFRRRSKRLTGRRKFRRTSRLKVWSSICQN